MIPVVPWRYYWRYSSVDSWRCPCRYSWRDAFECIFGGAIESINQKMPMNIFLVPFIILLKVVLNIIIEIPLNILSKKLLSIFLRMHWSVYFQCLSLCSWRCHWEYYRRHTREYSSRFPGIAVRGEETIGPILEHEVEGHGNKVFNLYKNENEEGKSWLLEVLVLVWPARIQSLFFLPVSHFTARRPTYTISSQFTLSNIRLSPSRIFRSPYTKASFTPSKHLGLSLPLSASTSNT